MDAVTYVRSRIESARRTSADRLPSIAAMAKASGIPLRQIHRAVIALRGPERLEVRRGSGILLKPRSSGRPPSAVSSSRRTAVDRAAAALVQRLRRGAFPDTGLLPSVKELSHELGVHRSTVRKVLLRLGDEGWVRRERRQWFVARHPCDQTSANHIVFLGRDLHEGVAQAVFPGAARMMTALDQECARRGIRLQFVAFDQHLRFPESGAENALRSALGAVIWPYSWPDEYELGQLVSRCRKLQQRLIVLDQTGRLPHPGQMAHGMNGVRCYSLSQNEPDGYDVAVHVLQRGHRHAAFLAYEDQAPWSYRRQTGVRSAFAACGAERGIRRLPNVRYPLNFRSPEMTSFTNAYREFMESCGLHMHGASSVATKPHQFIAEEATRDFYLRAAMARQLEPLFERALADRRTTVWICVSDDIAFAALQFLSARKVRVPADISLVGFDDSRLAMHYRFSSYNFNMHGVAAEMVEWALRGSPRREEGIVRRVEGFVNDRGTVAVLA